MSGRGSGGGDAPAGGAAACLRVGAGGVTPPPVALTSAVSLRVGAGWAPAAPAAPGAATSQGGRAAGALPPPVAPVAAVRFGVRSGGAQPSPVVPGPTFFLGLGAEDGPPLPVALAIAVSLGVGAGEATPAPAEMAATVCMGVAARKAPPRHVLLPPAAVLQQRDFGAGGRPRLFRFVGCARSRLASSFVSIATFFVVVFVVLYSPNEPSSLPVPPTPEWLLLKGTDADRRPDDFDATSLSASPATLSACVDDSLSLGALPNQTSYLSWSVQGGRVGAHRNKGRENNKSNHPPDRLPPPTAPCRGSTWSAPRG